VKYTEEGTITIAFEIREEEQDMLFSVKDTGIGINDDEKQNVFKRFNRLHNTKSRELRGTGLGLAICKHLVKLMGGNIWFDSEFGKGTAFYFNHPYLELERVKVKPVIPFIDKDRQA